MEGSETRAPESGDVVEASTPIVTDTNVLEQQGLQDISEADLMGDVPESTENTPAHSESSEEDKTPDPVEEEKEEVKAEEPKKEEEQEEPAKPPKGYVPLAAIHEVRGENKYLKEQLAELKAMLETKAAPPEVQAPEVPKEFADFQTLTDAEFQELAVESPAEALVYMKQLGAYQEYQRTLADNEKQQQATEEYLAQVYQAANAEMEKTVPGIFDADSPVAKEFQEYAVGLGFTEDMFYLTNPATRIILPGESEPLLLGEQAAQIVKLLANAKSQAPKQVDEAKLRAEIEKEMLTKIKSGSAFKSLSDVPATSEARPEFGDKVLTQAQFEKLSEKEQELYLAGN